MELKLLEILILAITNTFGVFLIIVILTNSSREKMYRWFMIMTVSLLGWVDFAYLGSSEINLAVATISYQLNMTFVALFFLAAYIFYIEYFLKINNAKFKLSLFIVSMILIFLSLTTNLVQEGITKQSWGNEANFGILDYLFYLLAGVMTIVFTYYSISKYITLSSIEKRKIIYFLIGTFIFMIFNVIFNVLSPIILGSAKYQHYGDYSAIFFLAFIAFAMLKREFLGVKIVLTAFLISIIGLFLIVDILLLSGNTLEQWMKSVFFLFFIGISVILMRSVLNEIKQKEQLQDTLRKERDMLDILGHELRTPMSIARNAISLIKSNIKKNTLDDAKLNKYIDMADENIKRETKLLETMLSTTKLDKGDLGLDLEKVDLNDVIDDSLEGLKKKATNKGLDIIYNPKEQLYIYADRSRIQEVTDNLIDNAVKYTKKGHIEIKISRKNDKALIEIIDTGVGIPESDLPNLGKKFFRVDTYLKGDAYAPSMDIIRPGGTGLGLYVTTNLVKAMDGTFHVKSKVDVGSMFTLTFPLFDGQDVKTVQKDITKLDKIAEYKKRTEQ